MEFNLISIIGLAAATCTTWSFLPQVFQIIKTHDTKAISLPMYIILTTGVVLWLIYGLIIGDLPLILSNFITLIFSVAVLYLKLKYKVGQIIN